MASRRSLLNNNLTLPVFGTINVAVLGGLAVLAWFLFLRKKGPKRITTEY